ncbi:hypothetical protein VV11_019235 [Trichodesmium erythraeum 21-75]|nr:hypothetical protein [Trichodesmium erythraeum 21-75]
MRGLIITGKNEKARTRLKLFEWIVSDRQVEQSLIPTQLQLKIALTFWGNNINSVALV